MEEFYFGYCIAVIIWGIIWGIVVKKVIENKGYYENWFWWGFFFGWIALIVALTKPNVDRGSEYKGKSLLSRLEEQNRQMETGETTGGNWKCYCGRVNPMHTGTCDCGRSRKELQEIKKKNEEMLSVPMKSTSIADSIKQYKELLDIGAITEEEFEKKKKELLNL